MGDVAYVVLVIVVTVLLLAARDHRRLRCTCGHPHLLLRPHHERATVMLAFIALWIVCLVILVLGGNRIGAILGLLNLWRDGYRLWVHENGRRRKAARALGRVVSDVHRRLRVVPT